MPLVNLHDYFYLLDDFNLTKIRNTFPGDRVTIHLPDGSDFSFEITEENMNEINQFTMASCASLRAPIQFSVATCQTIGVQHLPGTFPNLSQPGLESKKTNRRIEREEIKLRRKQLKAEAKAQDLLKSMIGNEQWRVYRKTNRIILKPNSHFWIIGDYMNRYDKSKPFFYKPDVIRIDDKKRLYATEFCVDQAGGDITPYTDKIIAFASHCAADEKQFKKTINRTGERKLKTIKECAIWNL